MSEAKEAAPAKKKNMLPVIVAVVAVLGGGGFFMMKGGGGKEAEKEEEKSHKSAHLGHTEEVGEFVVNLKDGSYLSTKIAVHCAEKESVSSKGDGHGGGVGVYPFINDAIVSVLTKKSLEDLSTVEGKHQLRRELAYHMNRAYTLYAHVEEGKPKRKLKKSEIELKETPEELRPGYEPESPELDSDDGPVLKVYFLTFTTQRL
jgi:flagellar FliL protein